MTSLLGAKKRAEEFAAAVDGRSPRSTGNTELAELADLVGALRSVQAPAPRPEFTASLRERLLAEAETTLQQNAALTLPPRRKGARERRLVVAASAFVLVGGSAGMAAAAQGALPGDTLYPIKRGLERAQADLSTSDSSKGQHLLDQADDRLVEVRSLLAESPDSPQVQDTLRDFTAQATEGADLLLSSFEDDRDPADVLALREFAAEGLRTLQSIAATAPAGVLVQLTYAAQVLASIDESASAACSTCAAGLPDLQIPASFRVPLDVAAALERAADADLNNTHPAATQQPAKESGATTPDAPAAPAEPPAEEKVPGPLAGLGQETEGGLLAPLDDVTGGTLGQLNDTTKQLLPDELDPLLDTLLP